MHYAEDPLAVLANLVLDRHAASLPDLSGAVVLLPDMQTAPRLRRLLLGGARQRSHEALLGPAITTPRLWLQQQRPATRRLLNIPARELLLVEALNDHPVLLRHGSPWTLAENLIALFDELTLQETVLPRDGDEFLRQLADAYGVPPGLTQALSNEARLVHTLWHAYHRQLGEADASDDNSAYRSGLETGRDTVPAGMHCYLAGFDRLFRTETAWAKKLIDARRLTVIVHGRSDSAAGANGNADAPIAQLCHDLQVAPDATRPGPRDGFARFLDTAFATPEDDAHVPLALRAQRFAAGYPDSPATTRLFAFAADSAEREAQAIDLQVRRWWLAGHRDIGIVTEDRRLARRVRALLERAGIRLQDTSGWALSTTSAGAALERWLESVEEDFAHLPLLDLLKSAFVFPERDSAWLQGATFRLEQDIMLHENVGRGIERYRRHMQFRRQRLGWPDTGIDELLDALQSAAAPLTALVNLKTHAPTTLLDALESSLAKVGMTQRFATDPAGTLILEQISRMRAALDGCRLRMTWREFRAWLGRQLETSNFRPHTAADGVQLLGLAQSRLCRFDALVIGGADREHLPRHRQDSPFFNDAVRRELSLTTGHEHVQLQLHHFRRLLEAAPTVLITHCGTRDGNEQLPGPWVQLLSSFHRLAYGRELSDNDLGALTGRSDTMIADRQADLPAPRGMPAPAMPMSLLPDAISASSYQQLVNCPYQFFAAAGLKLRPADAVREALQKDEYGEKVHRILQAFHGGHARLPGPYTGTFTAAGRVAASELLEQISRQEFAANIEDNFLHRSWLTQWLAVIPAYIDWQIERELQWRVLHVEAGQKRKLLGDTLTIAGRIDRIDAGPDGIAIIDYKTGNTPGKDDVLNGESVQLPFYGLLADVVPHRAEFLKLGDDRNGVKSAAALEGAELDDTVRHNKQRLTDTWQALQAGAPLPAWGDDRTCARCPMQGVCRRQAWATASRDAST